MFGWIPVLILLVAGGSSPFAAGSAYPDAISHVREQSFAQACRILVQPGKRIEKRQLIQLHNLLSLEVCEPAESFESTPTSIEPPDLEDDRLTPAAPVRAGP